MNRLAFSRKIGLIGFLFCIPIAVLAILLANKLGDEIAFARSEREGLEVINPARQALQAIQAHRGTSQILLTGDASAQSRLDQLAESIDRAFAALDNQDKIHGTTFKTATEWAQLKYGWEKLKSEGRTVKADEDFARHSALVEGLTNYMTATADGSNLSLDPDLDTYYLMDAVVFRIPTLVESLARMRGLGAGVAARKSVQQAERIAFAILARLAEIDVRNLNGSLDKVVDYNPGVKGRLAAPAQASREAIEAFRAEVDAKVVNAERIEFDANGYFARGTVSVDTTYVLFDAAAKELDALLQARIDGVEQTRLHILGGVGLVLVAVLYLFFGFLLGVRESLTTIKQGTRRIADGDLRVPVALSAHDELHDVAAAVDQVMSTVNAFAAAQVELASRHAEGAISYRIDASAFPGAYGELATKVNDLAATHIAVTEKVVGVVRRYAIGDLSVDMDRLPGEQAQITAAIDGVKSSLQSINGDIAKLVAAAARGDFTVRDNAEKYQYDFRTMIEGLNCLMEVSDAGLNEVARVLGALAKGDLTERITTRHAGTFGQMRDLANETTEKLAHIVGQLREATESIHVAAGEIAQGNTNLSSRTEEQASSLEETASAMEELTATVRQNSEAAQRANLLAIGASEVAQRGGGAVGQVVLTMRSINESSRKIVDIIGVIDSIAFQTNILALNAAVEAARAGEQGRGFAVVAGEVRTLAQKSAAAALEIKALIADSVDRVAAGTRLVDAAGQTMTEIVHSVQQVTGIMSEISAASQEQGAGIEQVSHAITQMDEVTQQNAALVEEAAAAAESLEEQSQVLVQAVAVFRLTASPAEKARHRQDQRARPDHPAPAARVVRAN